MSRTREIEREIDLLRLIFQYDSRSRSGLKWTPQARVLSRKSVGRAGNIRTTGYWEVQLFGCKLTAHRIVWILKRGLIPDGQTIDHLNGNRGDNRITNLRLVTGDVNARARNGKNRNNTSGYIGVVFHPKGRWMAVVHRRKRIHLGYFDTAIEAAREYNRFVREWAALHDEEPRYLNPV